MTKLDTLDVIGVDLGTGKDQCVMNRAPTLSRKDGLIFMLKGKYVAKEDIADLFEIVAMGLQSVGVDARAWVDRGAFLVIFDKVMHVERRIQVFINEGGGISLKRIGKMTTTVGGPNLSDPECFNKVKALIEKVR